MLLNFVKKLALPMSLTCLLLLLLVVHYQGSKRPHARQVRITTTSGRVLKTFFDGLTPDPKRGAAVRSWKPPVSCKSRAGLFDRVGQLLGIGAVAHAQNYCDVQTNCPAPCYVQEGSNHCGTLTCDGGDMFYPTPSGWADEAVQTPGSLGCNGTMGCNCDLQDCFGCPS